jgi:Cohesin domain
MNTTSTGKGRLRPFFVAAAFAIAGIAAALVTSLGEAGRTSAETSSMLGFDVRPDSNEPASLGRLETCASADMGETFSVDVFVNNVSDLTKWELRVGYDARVLQLQEANYNFFLGSTPPGGNIFPTLFDAESDGRYFLAAAEVQGAPDSGSGVLARLTLKAVGEGDSDLSIVHSPAVLGPQLAGVSGAPVGDSSGDGIWDGSYLDGEIIVGDNCDGSAPVVTPAPTPAPTSSPRPGQPTPTPRAGGAGPGATTAPGDDSDPDGDAGDDDESGDAADDDHVLLLDENGNIVSDGDDGTGDDPGSEDPAEEASDNDGSSETGDEPSGEESDDSGSGEGSDGGDSNDSGPSTAGPGGDDGSGSTWVFGGLAAAAALVVGGGALYGVSRRRGG